MTFLPSSADHINPRSNAVLFSLLDHVLLSSDDIQQITGYNDHCSRLQTSALDAVSAEHGEKGDAKARSCSKQSKHQLYFPSQPTSAKRSTAPIKAGCSKRHADQRGAGAMQPMEQRREERGTAGAVQSAHRAVVGKRVGPGVVALQSAGPVHERCWGWGRKRF